MPPPGVVPPSMIPMPSANPNVISAQPNIMKPPLRAGEEEKKQGATIEAKPKIKGGIGDVTRFTPTAVKIKRAQQQKGKLKPTGKINHLYQFDYIGIFIDIDNGCGASAKPVLMGLLGRGV